VTACTSREAIVESLGGVRGARNEETRAKAAETQRGGPKRIVRHNITNIWFQSLTRDEALIASYFTVFTEIGVDQMGRYRDRLVPVGDQWLIAHRFVSIDWVAEDSTIGPASPSSLSSRIGVWPELARGRVPRSFTTSRDGTQHCSASSQPQHRCLLPMPALPGRGRRARHPAHSVL
jgi:hypothetical protein